LIATRYDKTPNLVKKERESGKETGKGTNRKSCVKGFMKI
jgi:hypothetical protein